MATQKSLTFTTAESNLLRVSEMNDGGILFEMPGEHGWEDSYESALSADDVLELVAFLREPAR